MIDWSGVINLTTIISTAITAAVNSITVYLTMRYVGKLVDRVEKKK